MTEVRDRLLDTADALFYAHGIRAIGVDAIAAEAGVSKRTLYRHFRSKDELVAAYLARRACRIDPIPDVPPLGQISAIFDRLERWFGSKDFRGCPFVNAAAELGGTPDHPALEIVASLKRRRERQLMRHLAALGADDPRERARELAIIIEGAVCASLVRGGDPQMARSARLLARSLLQAAGVPGAERL